MSEPKPESTADLVARLREGFEAGWSRPLEWRRDQLRQIARMVTEHEDDFLGALRTDLGKPAIEGWVSDLAFLNAEIEHILRHLDDWVRPQRVRIPLVQRPGRALVVREPLGVALVIAPWNYPVQLLMLPMASALAAGNCAIGKPSELTPTVSALVARLVPQYLDERCTAIVEGGVPETQELLAERFDHIFYTGNGRIARVVMEAAAKHLTPVTLELGGKSPAIVTRDADLDVAARRIAWGKLMNAGQTCVAPDYVLVHEEVEDGLLDALRTSIGQFYGLDPKLSDDYGRIVDDRHFDRLLGLLHGEGAGEIAVGGEADRDTRYISPTVLRGTSPESAVMQEEIFGPILPVITVADTEEAIDFVNERDKPLALYVFTSSETTAQRVVDRTSSGAVCVNHVVMHLAVPELPFGGVGPSGIGAYHGRAGFETFSHRKSVLRKPTRLDPRFAYPPFNALKQRILRRFL